MRGPYSIDDISIIVDAGYTGVYILSTDDEHVDYVGRSDTDLAKRISNSVREGSGYRFFWFEYSSSPKNAYLSECKLYHKYMPTDNTNHPAVPPGNYWRCPFAGCPWS